MKKIILILVLGLIGPQSLPKPVEVQIKDMKAVKHWKISNKTVAYYRHVKMPDGSYQELKSKVPLTDKQWLELANKVYQLQLEAEKLEQEVKVCPYCGRPM